MVCLVDLIDFRGPVPYAFEPGDISPTIGFIHPCCDYGRGNHARIQNFFFQNANWGKRGSETFFQYLSIYI